ncbi:MAG: hypothetical protein JW807_09565 [Spirochaetes bacterium]|nr:hypothetical protein [Spirochaetota bacterium]
MEHKKALTGALLAAAVCALTTMCDYPEKTWTFEVEDTCRVYAIEQTADGGYIAGGEKDMDFWVMKLNSSGVVQWEQMFARGAKGELETLYSIRQTGDGGYITAGLYREVPDADSFSSDIWILKIDKTGAAEWDYLYDLAEADFTYSILQTGDGGYMFVGGSRWEYDEALLSSWAIKLSPDGTKEWEKVYYDYAIAFSVVQTPDEGFAMAGSALNDATCSAEYYIRKLDPSGNAVWEKRYGRSPNDLAQSISATSDGGYIVAGDTDNPDYDNTDCWILKLDSEGEMQWSLLYGWDGSQHAKAVRQTRDNGYIMAGSTDYGPAAPNEVDYLIVKLDDGGNEEWSRTFHYDDSIRECAWAIEQTSDRGYIMGGQKIILKLDRTGRL